MAKKKSVTKQVGIATATRGANPNLTMIQAMHAIGGYSEQDCQNCTLQMAVCWHCNELAPPNFPVSVVHQPTITFKSWHLQFDVIINAIIFVEVVQ